jgi:DNA-binding GntR family transcriptional regulator
VSFSGALDRAAEPGAARPLTSSALIHAALRARIVTVDLKPGTPLVEKELAEEFGVSRTPVREALLRLAHEHLVDIRPQSGTYVSRIDLDAVREAMVIRQALERVSVREAAARATAREVVQLRRVLREQRAAKREALAFHDTDEKLHATIADIAGHPALWRVVRREKAPVDRFRILTLPLPGRVDRLIAQHTAVVDAIAAHDPEGADAAMQAHLRDVIPGFEALAFQHPEFFIGSAGNGRPKPRRKAMTEAGRAAS